MSNYVFPPITGKEAGLPFYLVGIGCYHEQEHVVRMEGYPDYQWIQCYEGEGELILPGATYSVPKGYGMLLYPDEPHEYYSKSNKWNVDWIIFRGHQIRDFLHYFSMSRSRVYSVSEPELLISRIRSIMKTAVSDCALRGLDNSIQVYDFLINLTKHISEVNNNSILQKHSRLNPVLDYIKKNYACQMSLEELSGIISVSPQHLCALFRATLNIRVFEYINNVRIQKSKELMLEYQGKQVKDIAMMSGFNDFSYFCSTFKKIEKKSAGEFRRIHGM